MRCRVIVDRTERTPCHESHEVKLEFSPALGFSSSMGHTTGRKAPSDSTIGRREHGGNVERVTRVAAATRRTTRTRTTHSTSLHRPLSSLCFGVAFLGLSSPLKSLGGFRQKPYPVCGEAQHRQALLLIPAASPSQQAV